MTTTPIGTTHEAPILGRRLAAWLVDALLVALLVGVLHAACILLGLVTLGAGWLLLALLPAVPFLYCWLSLGWERLALPDHGGGATPGQRLMGLAVVHHATGAHPSPLEAFVFTLLFSLTLSMPPLLLVALFTRRNRTLHDILSGLLVVHARPLTVRVGAWNMQPGTPR